MVYVTCVAISGDSEIAVDGGNEEVGLETNSWSSKLEELELELELEDVGQNIYLYIANQEDNTQN